MKFFELSKHCACSIVVRAFDSVILRRRHAPFLAFLELLRRDRQISNSLSRTLCSMPPHKANRHPVDLTCTVGSSFSHLLTWLCASFSLSAAGRRTPSSSRGRSSDWSTGPWLLAPLQSILETASSSQQKKNKQQQQATKLFRRTTFHLPPTPTHTFNLRHWHCSLLSPLAFFSTPSAVSVSIFVRFFVVSCLPSQSLW